MKQTYLLYDKEKIDIAIPDSWYVLEPTDPPAFKDLDRTIADALANPIASKPLREITQAADKSGQAVIVISDITRPVPNKKILPAIIEVLKSVGYDDENIKILVATGMHRPETDEEHIALVGREIFGRYEIIDHRASQAEELIELAERTSSGTSVRINKYYYQASLRIVTGFIEPHFMAGFSGGRKAICPGLVDLKTLEKFHGAKFLADANTRMGRLEGNPCHREALEIARKVKPDFLFNVTINAEEEITGIFAGDSEQAHLEGIEFVRKTMTVKVAEPFDVIFVTNGGYPLDTLFYQANKGMTAAMEYIKPNGTIILIAGCKEGIGSDSFREILFEYDDYKKFLADIFATDETRLDQWGFQMQSKVLEKIGRENLIMVTDGISLDELRRCHVTPADDYIGRYPIRQQVERLIEKFSADTDKRIAVIPRGPYILPRIG